MKALISLLILFSSITHGAEPEKWQLMQRAVLIEQDLDEIKSLVASGVDPGAPIGGGSYAPLDGAVQRQNVEMVELLLSLGANPLDRQLVWAAFSENHEAGLKMVRLLHQAGISINAREYQSREKDRFSTALHRAVWRENAELVAYLLEQKGIELDLLNVDGYTPLMIAVEKGSRRIFDMLLGAGANPKVVNARGADAAAIAENVIQKQRSFQKAL